MAFQVWVMGMTIIALLNESIPHLIAAFFTHDLVRLPGIQYLPLQAGLSTDCQQGRELHVI